MYEIGQNFILNKDYSFYNTNGELIDVSKGSVFILNDTIEGSDCYKKCCNDCKKCIASFMILFDTSDIEVRLTKEELDNIISK